MVLSHVLPLSCILHCFSYPKIAFNTCNDLHMKFDYGNFKCYEFNVSFPSHLLFGYPLEENFLASKL